jgi:starch synthase
MPRKLKILFVVAETWPLVKTGGLADVAPALARALADRATMCASCCRATAR